MTSSKQGTRKTGAAKDTTQTDTAAKKCAGCNALEPRVAAVEAQLGAMNHGAQWIQPAKESGK
jgi:hypothetical protein